MQDGNVVAKSVITGPAVFKYYIYDLQMVGTHKLSEGQAFIDSGGTHGFRAVPYTDDVTIYNPNKTELLWKIDRDNLHSLRLTSNSRQRQSTWEH